MTNQKAAIIRGMERFSHTKDEYVRCIWNTGLKITQTEKTYTGMVCIEAETETPRGTLRIHCGENGTARIDKPNGTHKWVYEKTPAQIAAQLRQVLDFYK